MRWGSGRAHGGAARAALAIELQSIAQRPLARGAARVAQLEMVRPAGTGGLLLGVAGAAVPNTFSEGHSGPLPRGFARKCRGEGASVVPRNRRRDGPRLGCIVTRLASLSLPPSTGP